jgi:hypothetical protein
MTNDTSLRSADPPTQADAGDSYGRHLGTHAPSQGVRLSLHVRDTEVLLLRHRSGSRRAERPDVAARATYADGQLAGEIAWDEYHRAAQPVWMPSVEDWMRLMTRTETGS